MSAGIVALLDDIAALARAAAASVDDVAAGAAKASTKALGVVVDDTAVTPQYVTGVKPERELSIIKRIAIGSIRNKLLFILPAALLLSQFVPWLLTPILMLGGTYLCFEGAEKVWEMVGAHGSPGEHGPVVESADTADEEQMVSSAIRTDFILSAEIMVISLNEVAERSLPERAAILVVVAVMITLLVYGVVALIVKMDDVGLSMAQKSPEGSPRQSFGLGLVRAMPKVLTAISIIGTAAMLWVGGHIILVGAEELGFTGPYEGVHHMEVAVKEATGALGAVTDWLTNTAFSALIGFTVGTVVATLLAVRPGAKH